MTKDDGLILRKIPNRTYSRIGIESVPNYLWTTPEKRKCDNGMEPELCQAQIASDSPAKRKKFKFNSLITFWGGGFEKESEQTYSKKKTLSGTNPVIVDGDEVKGGCPVDVDLEEGGGNQSKLSLCLN